MAAINSRRGRPRKYGRPSRAVTLTLPEDVLARLLTLDTDLGRAVVTLVDRSGPVQAAPAHGAEISSYGNHAVIVVNPLKALKRLQGVQLVPIGNGRALISLEPGHSLPQLELDLRDALERATVDSSERAAFEEIAAILRRARAARSLSLEQRTIIVLESKRRRA